MVVAQATAAVAARERAALTTSAVPDPWDERLAGKIADRGATVLAEHAGLAVPADPIEAAGPRPAGFESQPWRRWLKRIIVLPIGERFALNSRTAALAGSRTTFTWLLVSGLVATVYVTTGRVMRSFA